MPTHTGDPLPTCLIIGHHCQPTLIVHHYLSALVVHLRLLPVLILCYHPSTLTLPLHFLQPLITGHLLDLVIRLHLLPAPVIFMYRQGILDIASHRSSSPASLDDSSTCMSSPVNPHHKTASPPPNSGQHDSTVLDWQQEYCKLHIKYNALKEKIRFLEQSSQGGEGFSIEYDYIKIITYHSLHVHCFHSN